MTNEMITVPKCIWDMLWMIARSHGYMKVGELEYRREYEEM